MLAPPCPPPLVLCREGGRPPSPPPLLFAHCARLLLMGIDNFVLQACDATEESPHRQAEQNPNLGLLADPADHRI
jgi:hypothetical protein